MSTNGDNITHATKSSKSASKAARQAERPPGVGPRDMLFVLFKHRGKALAVFLFIAILSLLAVVLWPDKYRSEAKIRVKPGLESQAPDPATAGLGQIIQTQSRPDALVNSESELLNLPDVIVRVVDELGGKPFLGREFSTDAGAQAKDKTTAMLALQRDLDVRTEPLSDVIHITYDNNDDQAAKIVLDAYLKAYQEHRSSLNSNPQDARFLKNQLDDAQLKLAQVEQQLIEVKNRTRVSNAEVEEGKLIQRISEIRSQLDQFNGQLAATSSTITSIVSQLKTIPEKIVETESMNQAMSARDEMQQRINQLRLEEQDLRSRFLPESPSIQILEEKIEQAEKLLAQASDSPGARTTSTNPIYRELSLRLETARSDQKALQARLMSLQGDFENAGLEKQTLNSAAVTLSKFEREIALQKDVVANYSRGYEVAQMKQNRGLYNLSEVQIAQPATPPLRPVSPNRPLILLAGLMAAALAAVATALASEALDGSVSRPEQLQRLGVSRVASLPVVELKPGSYSAPIVGSTDTFSGAQRFVRESTRPGLAVPSSRFGDASISAKEVLQNIDSESATLSGSPSSAATLLHTPANQKSSDATHFGFPIARAELDAKLVDSSHDLVERLLLSGGSTLPQTIAIVGLQPGSGATTIATHIATALGDFIRDDASNENGRVLLIDGNLLQPGVEQHFSAMSGDGCSQWLGDGAAASSFSRVIRRTDAPRLDVLPAGAAARQLVGRLGDAIDAARALGYRAIVVDLPPVGRSETTARLAGTCDATILVAGYNACNREMIRQSLLRFSESGAHIAGAVLNKREFPVPDRLYNLF